MLTMGISIALLQVVLVVLLQAGVGVALGRAGWGRGGSRGRSCAGSTPHIWFWICRARGRFHAHRRPPSVPPIVPVRLEVLLLFWLLIHLLLLLPFRLL